MVMYMRNNKTLIMSILAILSIVLVTLGISLAFFNYGKEGVQDNAITTGSITFLYTEVSGVGNGIKIENTFPMSDEKGKVLTGEGEYFDFKVTSKTAGMYAIPYEVTARKSSDSADIDEYVRVYLTKGETNEEVLLDNYNNLTQASKVEESKYTEKTIYTGEVPEGSINYEESFRLKMWLDEDTRFDNQDMNNKKFTLTVNVYANARVVTNEEIAYESNTEITNISVEDTDMTKVENENYDYEIDLPKETTATEIITETKNPNATVIVEKIDSLASSNNIKRLSTTNSISLTEGFNYFKLTVTSENKKETQEYKLRISSGVMLLTDAILNKYQPISSTPDTETPSNNSSDPDGLYKWINPNNSDEVSYYFRGNVDNRVEFAEKIWRVVRINEDGSIRLIMENLIDDNTSYNFNPNFSEYTNIYYSNSNIENGAKYLLENWYQTNIVEKGYSSNIVTGEYFCEEAKVKNNTGNTAGNAVLKLYSEYEPSFVCGDDDGNQKGKVNASIGLITYDEVVFAGGYYLQDNSNYYLYNGQKFWTMSPAGLNTPKGVPTAYVWRVGETGLISNYRTSDLNGLRPVVNLNINVKVIGSGEFDNEWKVIE